jgi:hypothetical protein
MDKQWTFQTLERPIGTVEITMECLRNMNEWWKTKCGLSKKLKWMIKNNGLFKLWKDH